MRVISFGIYSLRPEYPRHRNLISALSAHGVEVIECHYPMTTSFKERLASAKTFTGRLKYTLLLLSSYFFLTVCFLKAPSADAVLVGYPGYFHVRFLRILQLIRNRKAVLVYDIFFSLYDAVVCDRQVIRENSLTARLLYKLESDACRAADVCLIDTDAHGDHIAQEFTLPRERIQRIFVGSTFATSASSQPRDESKGPFQVLFVGTYIPLHGIETILEAAKLLRSNQDIIFLLAGAGQLREEMESKARAEGLTNIEFRDWIDHKEMPNVLHSCGLALGIFGKTEKTSRVIPIKVFDICAAGVPFITADTPATREVFTHRENAFLIPPGNADALAEALLTLKENRELRERIAQGARKLAETVFSVEEIGRELMRVIESGMRDKGTR